MDCVYLLQNGSVVIVTLISLLRTSITLIIFIISITGKGQTRKRRRTTDITSMDIVLDK